ncbi:hypothetical protein PVAP13_8NG085704, partial [Panicum virgatum]
METITVGQLLFLLIISSAKVVIGSFNGNETDRLSLVEFKKAITHDPQQVMLSWNDSTHFCNWEGVLCPLGLEENQFTGPIPEGLGNLNKLQKFSLFNNIFTGSIPSSLSNLSQLGELFLDYNKLDGEIPPSLGNLKVLEVLEISTNNLHGSIPKEIFSIPTIRKIGLSSNSLSRPLPLEIGKAMQLQNLYLSTNNLSSTIPSALGNCESLEDIELDQNSFVGSIPASLGNICNLKVLNMSRNQLSGSIPKSFGQIPPSLTNASNLYYIEISRNSFSGVVPSKIGRLNKLEMLNLEYNQLQAESKRDWEFLDSLANCTELIDFSMTGNLLQGQLPPSVGNLTNQLQYLYFAENQLSGEIPPGIANIHNLYIVSLAVNQFSGILPEWLGSLKNLQKMSLGSNFFSGTIPSSFSNLTQLTELNLESNRLVGKIPPSFGNLPILKVLNISNNKLYGSIPKELFRIPTIVQISLYVNNLDGMIHPDIGNARQLTDLQLSLNNLSGEIPITLGNCESLEGIEFDHNAFSGSIPVSLRNIRTLKVLNLSHNNLTGSIPASIGNLQFLEQLDLSFNKLKGEVPTKGIFNNRTAMRIDGNQGLCGGPPELHLPACPDVALDSDKRKLSIILKAVIPVAIVATLAVVISVLLLLRRRKQTTRSISLPSFGREIPKISYSDLFRATEGFATSNLVGLGSYGSVYQGKLFQDENVVAIKVFNLETRGAQKSFIAECDALRNVRHRNLVPILTACSTIYSNGNDFKALVYEFMPRGDLHNLLYSTRESEGSSYLNCIPLNQRLSILVDVSDALAYLHHSHQGTIVHCDLKPSNILLDNEMVAHVGVFGLASGIPSLLLCLSEPNHSGMQFTECTGGGHVSTASDVYSFGVVLLEIFIRRRPTDDMFRDGMSIAKFVEINFPENVLQIVDPQLLEEMDLSKETPPMAIKD